MAKQIFRLFLSMVVIATATMMPAEVSGTTTTGAQQFVLVYGEFFPNSDSQILTRLAAVKHNAEYLSASLELGRSRSFILTEIWRNPASYSAFVGADDTRELFKNLTPFLVAPLDERDGKLLTLPRTQTGIGAPLTGQIIVIAHVDILPAMLARGLALIKQFVRQSAAGPGVISFNVISCAPTTNHFQLVEVYKSLGDFDKHVKDLDTRAFRGAIQPLVGGLYDERRYVPFSVTAPQS